MTNETHTPGPWNVYFDDEGVVIRAGGDVMGMIINGLRMEANARLIEAAPELLQVARDYILLCDLHGWEGHVADTARAAVAKAENRSIDH